MATDIQETEVATTETRTHPLQAGDRLTRDEFLRRYETMPDINHAELIEGVVYMPSPVSAQDHGEPHFDFNGWLFTYRAHTPVVRGGDNSTLKLDIDNAPQPDGYLRLLPEYGGQSKLVSGYVVGAPELITEVSASSVSYDLHDKLDAYRRNGVREYVVWRVCERQVDWFVLRDGRYEKLSVGKDNVYRSEVFPGLWLDVIAVIEGNLARVLEVLQQGINSQQHSEFISPPSDAIQ